MLPVLGLEVECNCVICSVTLNHVSDLAVLVVVVLVVTWKVGEAVLGVQDGGRCPLEILL